MARRPARTVPCPANAIVVPGRPANSPGRPTAVRRLHTVSRVEERVGEVVAGTVASVSAGRVVLPCRRRPGRGRLVAMTVTDVG